MTQTFDDDGIPTSLVASFASDGASVLTGRENGVAAQLQRLRNAHILVCHCIAHQHVLATADAPNENEVATFVENNMHSVVNYHSNSTQRREHLEKLQVELQIPTLTMLRLVATRWLSRGGV